MIGISPRLILRFFSIVLTVALLILPASCAKEVGAAGKIGVVVTILPQAEFVESIGGERVDVVVMVPPGASPHTYEPLPSQMTALSAAVMYAKVGSGVDFELVWMDKLISINKDILVTDCSQGVEMRDNTGDSEHGLLDPHIWMSPLRAGMMVQNICNGLVQVDSDGRAYYEQNRDAYLKKLAQLDNDIRAGLTGVRSRTIMVYHPAFGYLAEDYGLNLLSVEEEGKEPTSVGLARLIELAEEHGIKAIFISPQDNPQSARVIADAIGGRLVFVDTLARDYIMNMRILLDEMVEALE
ncbi:metal ABC transporter solute-binding protein, Zn/Mn family [Chloroflexota bacterium]